MWNVKPEDEQAQPQMSRSGGPASGSEDRRAVAWIGKSVVFKGELTSSEDMRIEGRVEGTIELRDHDLIIGASADIRADVVAKTITVRGAVTGTLTASERIEVRETASIDGAITTPRLAMTEGATVQGQVKTVPAQAAGSAQSKASSQPAASQAKAPGQATAPGQAKTPNQAPDASQSTGAAQRTRLANVG